MHTNRNRESSKGPDSSGKMLITAVSSSLLGKVSDSLLERISNQRNQPTLDLSLCLLKKVPLDAIELHYGKQVESLDLAYNHLRFLPPKFTLRLNTMTKLNLARNELKRLPDNFGELEKLVDLSIAENQLETLPLSMGKLKKLERLDLSGNPFQSPLYNFLDALNIRVNRKDCDPKMVAPSVVKLLASLSHEVFPVHGEFFPTSPRGVTFDDHLDEGLSRRDEDNEHFMLTRRNGEMSLSEGDEKSSGWWSTLLWKILGAVSIVISISLIPLVLACFYSSPFFQKWVDANDHLEGFWRLYQPYHKLAEDALYSANILSNRPFIIEAPPPEPENFFQAAYHHLSDAFTSMLRRFNIL